MKIRFGLVLERDVVICKK